MTEASAERSFISYIGAEGELTAEDLASVPAEAGDYVYVSGYSLLHGGKAQALVDWVLDLPGGIKVVFDPGPLVDSPDAPLMQALLPRIDLWTSNRVEALRFTGATDIAEALNRLADHLPADVLDGGARWAARVLDQPAWRPPACAGFQGRGGGQQWRGGCACRGVCGRVGARVVSG